MKEITAYEKEAADFLKKHKAKMTISHISHDGEWVRSNITGGYLYLVRIDREGKSWTFRFSDCIANLKRNKRPGKYDVLACIEKYEPDEDVWSFAASYGYQICNKVTYEEAKRIFNAVRREYRNVIRMFGDCIDELVEIQ